MEDIKQKENISEKKQPQLEKDERKSGQSNHTKNRHIHLSVIAFIAIIVLTIFLSSIFGAFFGFVSGGVASVFSSRITQKIHQYFPSFNPQQLNSRADKQQIIVEDSSIIDVVKKSSPAVVSITISKDIPNVQQGFGDFFNPFFGGSVSQQIPQDNQGSTKQQVGGGSGFFITADGLLLTNRHVVEDMQASYTVVTSDGKQYAAKVLARDPVRDVAVIKIDGNNFPTLPLGDSDSLQIGQTTIAIGNSLGEFSNSVSRGIVSGLKRNLDAGSGLGNTERLTDIIQTDAAINLGNSGGPLIDIEGNVIGINVAMAQGAQNIGFALPINQAKRIIDQAKGGAKISIPFLGVRYIAIDPVVQKEAQLPFDYGVLVLRGSKITDLAVVPGSPADKAGIVENDIILEVNGQKINSDNQLSDVIMKYNVNDNITLKVWHKGKISDVQATLQESNK
jgi:S1-C subfamily serine protease